LSSDPSEPQPIPPLPKIINFLICYSTLDGLLCFIKLKIKNINNLIALKGYTAYVDWDDGTDFGTVLCDSLVNKGWSREFNSILIRVRILNQ
jgi:hypothetical protein